MISGLHFSGNRAVCSFLLNGEKQSVPWCALRTIWAEAKPSIIECGKIRASEDDRIVISLSCYSGQAGYVFVWDPKKKAVVYSLDAPFVVDAILLDEKIYALFDVQMWGQRPQSYVRCISPEKDSDKVFHLKQVANKETPKLILGKDGLTVILDGNEIPVQL